MTTHAPRPRTAEDLAVTREILSTDQFRNYRRAGGEETERFEAALYEDGRRIGTVSNGGCGGPDQIDFDVPTRAGKPDFKAMHQARERFAQAARRLPAKVSGHEGVPNEEDLTALLADAVQNDRVSRTRTLLKLPSRPEAVPFIEIHELHRPFSPKGVQAFLSHPKPAAKYAGYDVWVPGQGWTPPALLTDDPALEVQAARTLSAQRDKDSLKRTLLAPPPLHHELETTTFKLPYSPGAVRRIQEAHPDRFQGWDVWVPGQGWTPLTTAARQP
jgi:hypothetical protein